MTRDAIPPFRKGDVIKAVALERLRIDATRPERGPGSFTDGTGQYIRRTIRRERGIWFKPDTTVPAFGIMFVTGLDRTQGILVLETKQPDDFAGNHILMVNGPEDVDGGQRGMGLMIGDEAIDVLVDSESTLTNETTCGPKAGEWAVFEDLPGCIAVDEPDEDNIARVVEEPGGADALVRFELVAELLPGGTAEANPLVWTGAVYEPDTDTTIYVKDVKLQYWGRARDGGTPGARGYAKKFSDDDTNHDIIHCQSAASEIEFTTTEDIVPGSSAVVTVEAYHRGLDPTTYVEELEVHDPAANFPLALSGAKGTASLDLISREYRITWCQQMADTILCTVATPGSGDPILITSSITVLNPINGQTPKDGNVLHDPTTALGIANTFDDTVTTDPVQQLEATWNRDDDQWEVSEIKRPLTPESSGPAYMIEFRLGGAQYMEAPGVATPVSVVNKFYHGDTVADTGPTNVYDRQGAFQLALPLAFGRATWDERDGKYIVVECQQMATIIRCKVNDSYEVLETTSRIECIVAFDSGFADLLLPHNSMTPDGTTFDPDTIDVANRSAGSGAGGLIGYRMEPNDEFLAAWDKGDATTSKGGWVVAEVNESTIQFAKATAYPTNMGSPNCFVECVRTDNNGVTIGAGTNVDVQLPGRLRTGGDLDPDIYEDDVIQIAREGGNWFCVSPYLSSKIGELRWIGQGGAVPIGWYICDGADDIPNPTGGADLEVIDARGRFLQAEDEVGRDLHQGSLNTSIGGIGGERFHGVYACGEHVPPPNEDRNNHERIEVEPSTTSDVYASKNDILDAEVTDNRGPFFIAGLYQRVY